jgi:hypothetical protein
VKEDIFWINWFWINLLANIVSLLKKTLFLIHWSFCFVLSAGVLTYWQTLFAEVLIMATAVFIPILPNCKHCQKLGDGESIR